VTLKLIERGKGEEEIFFLDKKLWHCSLILSSVLVSLFFQLEQYFSLTTNQRTVLSAMTFQRSERALCLNENQYMKICDEWTIEREAMQLGKKLF
jgi:hypothetical protein